MKERPDSVRLSELFVPSKKDVDFIDQLKDSFIENPDIHLTLCKVELICLSSQEFRDLNNGERDKIVNFFHQLVHYTDKLVSITDDDVKKST